MADDLGSDIVLGIVGALIGQLSSAISKDDPDGNVRRIRSAGLWIAVSFQCVVAAVLVYAYVKSGQALGPLLSLNIGISADVILRGITRVASSQTLPGSTDAPQIKSADPNPNNERP